MKDFNLETFAKELEGMFRFKMEIIKFRNKYRRLAAFMLAFLYISSIALAVIGITYGVLTFNILLAIGSVGLGLIIFILAEEFSSAALSEKFNGVVFKDYEKTWETAYVTMVPNKRATVLIDCFANINIKLNELDYVFKKSETQSIDYITLFVNLYGARLSLSVPLSQLEKVNDNSKVRVNLELTVEQLENKFKAVSYKASLEELIVD